MICYVIAWVVLLGSPAVIRPTLRRFRQHVVMVRATPAYTPKHARSLIAQASLP